MAKKKIKGAYVLTGGGVGSLDSEAVADLADLDSFLVNTDGVSYIYSFDAIATDAENSPLFIRPDDYSSAGVHKLQSLVVNDLDIEGGTLNLAQNLDISGANVGIDNQLFHNGDSNTYLAFTGDQIDLVCGGVTMISLDETTQDIINIGSSGVDIDLAFHSISGTASMFMLGASGYLGLGGVIAPGEQLDMNGNISLAGSIIHKGDTNTNIAFTTDQIDFTCGGVRMLKLEETTQDTVIIGEANADIDFIVGWNHATDPSIFSQGSTGFVGLGGVTSPTEQLDVAGDIAISANIVHRGDTNTYFGFQPDQMDFYIGGARWFKMEADTQDNMHLGVNTNDMDIFMYWANAGTSAFYLQGSSGFIGINNENPNNEVDIIGTVEVSGDIILSDDLIHEDDTNTLMAFNTDQITFTAGGFQFIDMLETTQNLLSIGVSTVDLDIRIYGTQTDPVFYMEGSNNSIAIGGDTSPSARLAVGQESASGGIPVIGIKQVDVSEEMIDFDGTTMGVGNAIEEAAAKTLTATHFIKVTVNPGGLTRYIPVGTIA